MSKKKVLILGEDGIDRFVHVSAERFTPDTHTPIFCPIKTTENPGMAANCWENMKSMFGDELDVYFLCQTQTIKKTRFVSFDGRTPYFRFDEHDKVETILDIPSLNKVLYNHDLELNDFTAAGFSDYGKGFITKEIIKYVSERILTFADTKLILDNHFHNVEVCKINEKEWQNNLDAGIIGKNCRNLIVTKGIKGSELYRDGETYDFVPGVPVLTGDVSGLGDTYFSCLIGLYLQGYSLLNIMKIANSLCSICAGRPGVSIMSKDDLDLAKKRRNL